MLTMIPQGYKVAFHIKNEIGTMLEMIPERESLKLWTEMLTVHVMRNINGYTLDSFYAGMKEAWAAMCPCGSTAIVKRGHEKGLPTLFWSRSARSTRRRASRKTRGSSSQLAAEF